MDADLDFVVVWAESAGGESAVWGRRFDGSGDSVGPEFRVSTDTAAPKTAVDVAGAPDGSFVVVWQSNGQDGDAGGIFGQRFDAAGRRLGRELQVSSEEAGDQFEPSVSMGDRGDFAVVWTSHGQDGSDDGDLPSVVRRRRGEGRWREAGQRSEPGRAGSTRRRCGS